MHTEAQYNALLNAREMAFFRSELYQASPEGTTLQEQRRIINDMITTTRALYDAYREDFAEWPECERVDFFEDLRKNDPEGFDWWFDILLGGGDPIWDHINLLPA